VNNNERNYSKIITTTSHPWDK